jgi:glycosyltransferase involved in cell wall biosynthesis
MTIVLSFATHVEWHEGHAIARALARLGHQVRVVDAKRGRVYSSNDPSEKNIPGLFSPDATLDDVLAGAVPDMFIYIEPQGLLPRGLEQAPCRTVCVLCDTALSLAPRQDIAKLFDEVVLYHRDALHAFPDHQGHVHWMPFAVDTDLFPSLAEGHEPGVESRPEGRDLDIAYVGSLDGIWSERRRLLETLRGRFRTNDFERRVSNQEMAAIYRRARIVFHLPIADTITPRVFEAMAAGAMLLTGRRNNGIERLFDNGVHLVTFDGEQDLMDKAEYYLTHEEERARIAEAGHALVHRRHAWDVRLKAVFDELRAGVSEPAAESREPKAAVAGFSRPGAPARNMRPRDVEEIYQRHYKQRGAVGALVRAAAREPLLSPRPWISLGRAATTAWARRKA